MIFYRVRPEHALSQPAFRPGELYRYLGPTHPEGYVFVDLHGQRRCIWEASFERVEVEDPTAAAGSKRAVEG